MTTSYTVGQYKAWVRGRLRGVSAEDALLTDVANTTNQEICNAELWPFMETTFVGTAASGNRRFDLGATTPSLQLQLGLQLTAPDSSAIEPRYMPYQVFNSRYPDPDQLTPSRPWLWSRFGSILIIGPALLDQTYTFSMPYLLEPTPLAADATVVNIPDAFSEVFITGMLYRVYEAKGKFDKSQVIRLRFDGGDENHNGGLFGSMKRRLLSRQEGQNVAMGNGRQDSSIWDDFYGDA